MAEQSLREQLEEAYVDEPEDDEEVVEGGAADEDEVEEGGTAEEGEVEAPVVDDEPEKEKESSPGGVVEEPKSNTPKGYNAPIGFSPESREEWKNVPTKVQEAIHKREAEVAAAMQNSSASRRTHESITQMGNNYASLIAAEGASDPMQAINGMFQTVAELRMGSPQQRAQKMAQLISHYGVDIGMLDESLSGQGGSAEVSQASQMEQMVQQAVAPLYQQRDQQAQYQQQQAQQAVNAELAEFKKGAEFLNDVKDDMAYLIDLASKNGQKMSFQEAYDKCCTMNPQVSAVMSQRVQAANLQATTQKAQSKRNAASSLAPRPGQSGKVPPTSLRGEIEGLWDQYSQ